MEVHYGLVRVGDGWTIVGQSLKMRSFATKAQALVVARRFAGEMIGRKMMLHLQEDDGVLRPATEFSAPDELSA